MTLGTGSSVRATAARVSSSWMKPWVRKRPSDHLRERAELPLDGVGLAHEGGEDAVLGALGKTK
jgi:hypothetical protein